jgi:SMI1 / KNR4 family (SUKH-1)
MEKSQGDVTFDGRSEPSSEEDICKFESQLGCKLPGDYRLFIKTTNGGRPRPSAILLFFDGKLEHWGIQFFFGLNDSLESNEVLWNFDLTKQSRDSDVMPIAIDDFGNFFYLGLLGARAGKIYFAKTPSNFEKVELIHVCDSFSDLVGRLVPDEMLTEFD